MLAAYGFVAALPVWLLLAPRDYLSTYMKIGTISALALVLLLYNLKFRCQLLHPLFMVVQLFQDQSGPYAWLPLLVVRFQGFHSNCYRYDFEKCLTNESEIRALGFGGMLVESFVALMALIAATSLFLCDYFAINTSPAVFATLNMSTSDLGNLSHMVGENAAGRPWRYP